jgi:hypothetical protein
MTLLTYLQSIGWLDDVSDATPCTPPNLILAHLLDLDLSVDLADVLDEPSPTETFGPNDVDILSDAGIELERGLNTTLERFALALLNWERGRYRVMHGSRARGLIEQDGFGTPDDGSERWVRTGRMVWLSVLEFVETHFKRARMKIRVAHTAFRNEVKPTQPGLVRLIALDHILLKAKLRRLDEAVLGLVRTAQRRFRTQWRDSRPALETADALEGLIEGLSIDGWLGTFIAEFGHAFGLVLKMELEAATVLTRACASKTFQEDQ